MVINHLQVMGAHPPSSASPNEEPPPSTELRSIEVFKATKVAPLPRKFRVKVMASTHLSPEQHPQKKHKNDIHIEILVGG